MKFSGIYEVAGPNLITQDWYGQKRLTLDDMTLQVNEGYGIGANFFVLLGSLAQFKKVNLIPNKINIKLKMYHNHDLYKDVFYIDNNNLQKWKSYDRVLVERFCNNGPVCKTAIGIGNWHYEIIPHLDTIDCLMQTYFNFQETVINKANEIILSNNIDVDNTTFIWWRKGNKPSEVTDYPTYAQIVPLLIEGHTNILQTDDVSVLEEFKGIPNLKTIDVLPVFNKDTYIDKVMHESSDEAYREKYNKEYCAHVPDTFALAIVASRCKRFIGYPGHMSQLVCVLRRDFNKQAFIIKNNRELF